MPKWVPKPDWADEDVFIIGGGDSLRGFNWSLLKDERTIGCNDAYKLGEETCKVCVFGDVKWFRKNESALAKYKGVVFTNANQLYRTRLPWLWTLQRKVTGLSRTKLAWNWNTGAVAINLALLFGAKRIFLLGFDMQVSKNGRANWHSVKGSKPNTEVYSKFLMGFMQLSIALKTKFNCEVINVTDNSNLDLFPKVACDIFWKERTKNVI